MGKHGKQQEGGSSDKPGILNLFHHHLLPFLPLSLLQQQLESSGRVKREKEARNEQRKNGGKTGQRKLCTENPTFNPPFSPQSAPGAVLS